MTTARRTRRFDRDQVAEAALRLLDEGGPAALSVRAVAASLGVLPNALYTYVPDRAALEAAVVERVLGLVDLSLLDGPARSWRTRVERFAVAVRAVLLDHPGAVGLLMSVPLQGPVAVAIGEGLLAVFDDAGLGRADGARASYAVMVLTLGSVSLDVAETDGRTPLAPEADRIAARLAAFGSVDADAAPRTAAARTTMAAWVGEDQFRWTLRALLDGATRRGPHPHG